MSNTAELKGKLFERSLQSAHAKTAAEQVFGQKRIGIALPIARQLELSRSTGWARVLSSRARSQRCERDALSAPTNRQWVLLAHVNGSSAEQLGVATFLCGDNAAILVGALRRIGKAQDALGLTKGSIYEILRGVAPGTLSYRRRRETYAAQASVCLIQPRAPL